MSYLFISRWLPRVQGSPGWLSTATLSQMAFDAAVLRQFLPNDPRSDSELQALLKDYLTKADAAAHLLSTVGYLYRRINGADSLVMTAMSFMTQEDFNSVQSNPEWSSYITARNIILDMVAASMESKHFISNDPTIWDQITQMSAAQMSTALDNVTNPLQHIIYP